MLIAEGGATKCDFAVVLPDGTAEKRFSTEGMNPFSRPMEEIRLCLREQVLPQTTGFDIAEIFFYGAGVVFDKAEMMRSEIESVFPKSRVLVFSDMDAAVRASVGDGTGIVCILGTGSNSCYVENGQISEKVASLGYILGDEGSGNAMGKALLGDILKGIAPKHIIDAFTSEYGITQADILEHTYRQPMAARYLASFAKFLSPRICDPYVRELVDRVFTSFARRCVMQYPPEVRCFFTGSVAVHFESILRDVMRSIGRETGGVSAFPIDGLIRYHTTGFSIDGRIRNDGVLHRITEEPSLYDDLERKQIPEILNLISIEDHRIADVTKSAIPAVTTLLERMIPMMKRGGRLFYIGAGTSGRLGVLDASEVPPTFGMPQGVVIGIIAGGDRALRFPVEGAEDDAEQGWKDLEAYGINSRDTVVGIAASGTTPYVIGAVREARSRGILTASISSNPGSPLFEASEIGITTAVGPEFITGSSRMKSGTAQKLLCNMITTTAMIGLGRIAGNRMVNMQLSNAKLVDRGTRMIVDLLGLQYDEARRVLLTYGSVQKAVEALKSPETECNA